MHFWSFDGLGYPIRQVCRGGSLALPMEILVSPGQHDAYAIAAWLSQTDNSGQLSGFLQPALNPTVRAIAEVEGWILGVL